MSRLGAYALAAGLALSPPVTAVPILRPEVKATYPHDPNAYTQGLVIADERLFESTGLWGRSSLREVELSTGAVLRTIPRDDSEFGEGLAYHEGRLIQLTFDSGLAYVHHPDSFDETGTFEYAGEGWGLCSDGERLLMSDGSDRIQIRSPETFELISTLAITEDDQPFSGELNELECLGDKLLANVWPTNHLVYIDVDTGKVLARVDAYGLLSVEEELASGVLNGIAFDESTERLYLTGKLWPKLFEVSIPLDAELGDGGSQGCSMSPIKGGSHVTASSLLVLLLAARRRRRPHGPSVTSWHSGGQCEVA